MENNKTRLEEKSTRQIFYANQTNFFKVEYNGGTTSSSAQTIVMPYGSRMNFLIDFNVFHKYSQIKSMKLRIKTTSIYARYNFNGEQTLLSNTGNTYGTYSTNDDGYIDLEVVNESNKNQTGEKYYSICFLNSMTVYKKMPKPQLIIEYIDDKESIVNQKYIGGTVGRALNYEVNVRSGRPIYTKSLMNVETTIMPINLGLYFDPLEMNQNNYLNGWRFTYDIELMGNEEGYEYRDFNGLRHQFVRALNSQDVYYDIAGTGLILTKIDDIYTIEDGYNNKIYIDFTGIILSITKKVYNENNEEREYGISFRYETNTKKIKEIREKVSNVETTKVTIDYSESEKIKINALGYEEVVIQKNSLNQVEKIIEEDNRESYYTYKTNGLLESAYSDNGEKTVFTYDSRNRVSSIKECVTNETNIIKQLNFEYDNLKTYVTDKLGVKIKYQFDEEGELIKGIEIKENEAEEAKEKKLYYGKYDIAAYSDGLTFTKESGNLELEEGKFYIATIKYKYESVNGLVNDVASCMGIHKNNISINDRRLSYASSEEMTSHLDFLYSGGVIDVYVKNNYSSTMNVLSIEIKEKKEIEESSCMNWLIDNDSKVEVHDETFYQFEKMKFKCNTSLIEGKMYYEDVIETQRLMQLPSYLYNVWYNKKRGLVANVDETQIVTPLGDVNLDELKLGKITSYYNQVSVSFLTYVYSDYHFKINTVNKQGQTIINETIEYYDISERLKKREELKYFTNGEGENSYRDYYIKSKEYGYDEYDNLIRVTSNEGQKTLAIYEYDKRRLLSETTYINDESRTIRYNTNVNNGRIESVVYPDGRIESYEYYDNTTDKLKNIKHTVNTTTNINEIEYDKDKPSKFKTINSYGISLSYDDYNKINLVKKYNKTLYSIDRNIYDNSSNEVIYYGTNGSFYKVNVYDKYGRLEIKYESRDTGGVQKALEYYYAELTAEELGNDATLPMYNKKDSKLRRVKDLYIGNNNDIYYDVEERIIRQINTNTTYKPSDIEYEYDEYGRLKFKKYENNTKRQGVTYNLDNGEVSSYTYSDNSQTVSLSYEKDDKGRIIEESITYQNGKYLKKEYEYIEVEGISNLINSVIYYGSDIESNRVYYRYDNMNRIVEVYKKNGQQEETISKYIYDTLGRLVRENNKDKNVTNIMSYDGNVNILTKDVAGYTESQYVNYTRYSSSYSSYYIDEIVSYNNQSITTSETGNITQIGTKEFKWTRGNLLSQVNNSNKNTYYSYDASGVRINKTTNENGITKSHEYQCEGTRILKEKITKNEQTQILEYIYLANQIVGFKYQGNYYFFQKNLQGDIIKIYDINNTLVAHYKYDAWGNHTVYDSNGNVNTLDTFIGNINPFRYRGYYYDVETGLFMVGHRYYNPEWGRWIQPDDIEYLDPTNINGLNLYAYCNNDPVNMYDPDGHMPQWAQWALGIGFIAIGIAASIVTGGVASGLIAGCGSLWASIGIGAAAGAIGGAASGFAISVGTQTIANGFENVNYSEAGFSALTGAISGAIAGGILGGVRYALTPQKIANAVSGYNSAQSQMNSFYSMGAKNIAGMPFGGSNIVSSIGKAAASYNSAYTNLIISGADSIIWNVVFSGVYSGVQFGIKSGIEKLLKLI